jgi:thioredoxin reductase
VGGRRRWRRRQVTVHFNSTPVDVYPDLKGQMAGLEVSHTSTGEVTKVPLAGLFYGIGHTPNTCVHLP